MITPDRMTRTTCPYCGVGCTLDLHARDDYIYKVTSPFDAVSNHGNLCVKGRFGYDFVYNRARVLTPLIRVKRQQPGSRAQAFNLDEWRSISWDEALDHITNRLTEISRRSGADSLAFYGCAKATNEDNFLLQKMARALFRTNNIDHCTRLCHAGSVVALQKALGSSAMSNTAAEVIENDVFIITGSNTAETHPIIAIQMKAAVRKYGAKLIVVDPRRIEMVKEATMWLALKPGTDVALFSAMAHVILKEKLYNEAFIRARTQNFEAFAESMEKFTPAFAEEVSGVPVDQIVQAARLYARAKNGAIYWTLGISQSSHGTDNALSIIHLALLTGHIGRRGTGLNPLRGQNNVQGTSDAGVMPWHYPGYQPVDSDVSAEKFEKAWRIESGGLSRRRGLTTTEIISAAATGEVRSLYIMGENPMMSEPNLNHTHELMKELEFIVAQDLFINESGAFADVFLPSCSWAEKDGTFTNTDRRVQRVRKAIEPRGKSRPDWSIICDLAQRIEKHRERNGASAYWGYSHSEEILREMGRLVPEYAGVTYARIETTGLQTPVLDENHPGTPVLFTDTFPSGRATFHPLQYIPSAELVDAEYSLILTTGRVLEHWHGGTMTRHGRLDELYPEALVEVHPGDAARLGVKDGQAVHVASRRGTVCLRARVTDKTTPGVVFIPFFSVEASANTLTIDVLDPYARIPEYKICAVRMTAASEEDLPHPHVKAERGRW